MFLAWMLMLVAGNLGHKFNDPRWFVSFWFILPFAIAINCIFRGRSDLSELTKKLNKDN